MQQEDTSVPWELEYILHKEKLRELGACSLWKRRFKVEQGLFFAEIAAFNYEREVIEMAEDMTKGKEETVTSCCTANSNQGKMPKAVHNNRLHRRFPGDTQQNSRTEGSLCQN